MNRLSLRQNFAWTLSGQAVYALGQWAIVALLARQMTPSAVGQFVFATALAAPVITFTNLRLRSIQASDSLSEFQFGHYLALRLLATAAAFVLILGIAFVFADSTATALVIGFVGIAKAFEAISDVLYGLQQQHDRMDRVARSNVVKGALSVASFYMGLRLTGEVYGGAAAMSLAWLLVLVGFDVPSATMTLRESQLYHPPQSASLLNRHIRPIFTWSVLRNLLWLAIPLGLTSTIAALSANIPRYAIELLRGSSELGVFAALIYPMTVGSLLVGALAQSSVSRLSQAYRSGDTSGFLILLRKLLVGGMLIGSIGVVAALLLGKPALRIVYGGHYAQYSELLVWAAINAAIGYSYLFLGTALNAMRRFTVQLPIHLASLTALSLASLLLVSRWGINGAMGAFTIAALLEALLYASVVVRVVRSARIPSPSAASQLS